MPGDNTGALVGAVPGLEVEGQTEGAWDHPHVGQTSLSISSGARPELQSLVYASGLPKRPSQSSRDFQQTSSTWCST